MKSLANAIVCLVYSTPSSLLNLMPPGVVGARFVTMYSTAWIPWKVFRVRTKEEKKIDKGRAMVCVGVSKCYSSMPCCFSVLCLIDI